MSKNFSFKENPLVLKDVIPLPKKMPTMQQAQHMHSPFVDSLHYNNEFDNMIKFHKQEDKLIIDEIKT